MVRTRRNHYPPIDKPATAMVRTRRNGSNPPAALCKCGCGQAVARGRSWVLGHNNRGKNNIMYGKENPNAGRPSTYEPWRCGQVVELMKDGLSRMEAARKMGHQDATLKRWGEEFPEFAAALKYAHELEETWWQQKGRDNLDNNKFNTGLYVFMMANKFNWTRTDKLQIQQSGKLEHEHTHTGKVKLDADDIGNVTAVFNILVQSGAIRAVGEGKPLIAQGADTQDDQVLSAHPDS